MPDDFLTVAEVADRLRLNQQTVRNTIDRGELKAVRVGPRRVRVREADLAAFIEAGLAQMGPSEDQARANFAAAQAAVDAATTNPELATALRRLATAATKLASALPRR